MKMYIAGPMRGLPGFNFREFDKARDYLTTLGIKAFSPADHDRATFPGHDWDTNTLPKGFTIEGALTWDLKCVIECDAIAVLPGWEKSKGTAEEVRVAQKTGKALFRLVPTTSGKVPYQLVPWGPPEVVHRALLLDEAKALTTGDRNATYGSPTQNFQDVAGMWNIQFRHLLKPGAKLQPQDVAAAMVALKLVRRVASDKADNWTDMAGYTACGYEAAVESGAFEPLPNAA